ncbi:Hsp20/alpha crystallin family protein [Fusobacterium mortiferum]|jgi:HSP20 family protein|uniref:Hsp20/alpha crystallin family protein n=1 Tax=Fusobacterium mortiferum TaxID=850 RepID=UPI0025D0C2BC|nr:Hsp20/alpha crystallin family protein [uncultured Fusobacterium sp.]MDD7261307.1 Hsp20/alpha crystallin family protein [Fusobacterium mortiferum]MDY5981115.1 Hsp20/alpha crystallin family protein [Fusobacterium mortiferum]
MLMPSIFRKGFIDDVFEDDFFGDNLKKQSSFGKTDIKELKDNYLLEIELPGFNKEDIKAEINNGYLIVTAAHNENKDEKDKEGKYIRKERYTGQFTRSFYIGDNITQEDIKGKFENGLLKLEVPKKEVKELAEEKKYIQIEG